VLLPCLQRALGGAAARGSGVLRLRLPALSALGEFLLFAGPGFFALLGKVVCYSSMSYAAAACGTVALAAHQVCIYNVSMYLKICVCVCVRACACIHIYPPVLDIECMYLLENISLALSLSRAHTRKCKWVCMRERERSLCVRVRLWCVEVAPRLSAREASKQKAAVCSAPHHQHHTTAHSTRSRRASFVG